MISDPSMNSGVFTEDAAAAEAEAGPPMPAIRAVLIPIDGYPRETLIQPSGNDGYLDGLQDAVDGYIELFTPLSADLAGADLFINDDGLFGCPPNRAIWATASMEKMGYLSQVDATPVAAGDLYTILHGDIVAVGHDPETGESISLTDEQVAKVRDYFTETSGPDSWREARDLLARPAPETDIERFLKEINDEIGDFFDLGDIAVVALGPDTNPPLASQREEAARKAGERDSEPAGREGRGKEGEER